MKGIGIIAVVIGHCYDVKFVYTFHMPLFFLIAGFTFRVSPERKSFFKSNFNRLMIPYITFFILLLIPYAITCIHQSIKPSILPKIWGGEKLSGLFTVFWFVSVLFCSKLVFNELLLNNYSRRFIHKFRIMSLITVAVIAYIFGFSPIPFPLNLHVVPMAVFFMLVGYYIRPVYKCFYSIDNFRVNLIILISFVLLTLLAYHYTYELALDMKTAEYGLPIFSIIFAVLYCITIGCICIWADRNFKYLQILAAIGESSMTIMYLHQAVNIGLRPILPITIVVLLCIILPMSIEKFTGKYRYSRKLILGLN